MRKLLIAAVVATSALTAAAPAAAQYYPAPQPYGYGYNNYGQQGLVRSYINRIDHLRSRINQLDNRDRISEREARGLRNEAAYLRDRVARSGYNGLTGRERRNIDVHLASLERRIGLEIRDGNRRWNPDWRDGRQDGRSWNDRDRDGRNDRYEDDRGRWPG